MNHTKWRKFATAALGFAAVSIVVTGTSLAAGAFGSVDPATGLINACVNSATGATRIVNSAADCKPNETPLTWKQKGDTGTTGPQGLTGETGATGMPGKDGSDGLPGQDGTDGINGLPGDDGKDGSGLSVYRGTTLLGPLTSATTHSVYYLDEIDGTVNEVASLQAVIYSGPNCTGSPYVFAWVVEVGDFFTDGRKPATTYVRTGESSGSTLTRSESYGWEGACHNRIDNNDRVAEAAIAPPITIR